MKPQTISNTGVSVAIDCQSIFVINDVALANKIKAIIKEHEDNINTLSEGKGKMDELKQLKRKMDEKDIELDNPDNGTN